MLALWDPMNLCLRKLVHCILLLLAISASIVSSSTDSELKSWHTEKGVCLRTYRGHTNDKNFVGLTVTPDFIACGMY